MSPAALILAAALPCAALAAPAEDADFEPERPAVSGVLGPAAAGTVVVSAHVGWLRSGLGAALGLGGSLDLVLHADTMLLYRGLAGQTGFDGGLRFSPIAEGPFRMGAEVTLGLVLAPAKVGRESITALRGELVLGAAFDLVTPYARLEVRRLSGETGTGSSSTRDEEVGVGLERTLGRFALAAEVFTWARPGHTGFLQWRLNGAVAF